MRLDLLSNFEIITYIKGLTSAVRTSIININRSKSAKTTKMVALLNLTIDGEVI